MLQQLFNLVEHTHRSVFLTGKAGTGKTTFLTDFVKRTRKKFIVLAPTGIAAINAGGVTIHSMFGLPLKTHVPVFEDVDPNIAINIPQLLPHFKYRRDKLKLLRNLDLVIVDEVSMLRCDVMDMMDLALRKARRSTQKFGGVQLLLIGDLYQLPPVVKADAEKILYKHYRSPFFFDAEAIQQSALLTVELKKVYRQTDAVFLQLLNAIRNNEVDEIDFDLLHSRYQPDCDPRDSYVYLTSHNFMADAINRKNLDGIKKPSIVYEAIVTDDFKPHLYPNDAQLQLKEGAQVMFIRNDTSEAKRYYNGKLAKVTALAEDFVKVLPDGESTELEVERETWEHKKYHLGNDKEVQEEVVGSFEQFPFRLAWAITIHKSQGLTFDRVIIDAGRSFSSGQVYVALSRCRTLEGIILKSPITAGTILTDERISWFQQETGAGEKIEEIVEAEKYAFAMEKLLRTLSISWLEPALEDWLESAEESKFLKSEEVKLKGNELLLQAAELKEVLEKFTRFVQSRVPLISTDSGVWKQLEEKSEGAVKYFFEKIRSDYFEPLNSLYGRSKGVKGLKGYNKTLKTLLDETSEYLQMLQQCRLLETVLLKSQESVRISKAEKMPSHSVSFEMFKQGKSPAEIAAIRELTTGTVLNHLSKMAGEGLDISRLFSNETIAVFEEAFNRYSFASVTQWKNVLPETMGFDEIRLLLRHFSLLKK